MNWQIFLKKFKILAKYFKFKGVSQEFIDTYDEL